MAAFLEHPFRLNDAVFRIAAKVGVALFPDDGADADTLFRNAEAALKKAKASGERYLFYTQRMTEAVAGKLTLENQLRQALDNGEFVLHYQPKVNLASGKLTGAEALIRWNDPRTGLVPPGRFIPILEETGLIHEVGRWALRQGHRGLPALARRGPACGAHRGERVAAATAQRGFIAEIRQAIGIDAHAAAGLELEITESLIMEDVKHSIASLQAIRAMGVTHRHRRLRHRLFLAQLPRQTAGGHAEDRPLVRDRHDGRAGGAGAGVHHHQPGAFAEAQGGGGGRRNRGAVAPAALAGLRRNAGLPVQQAGAGRDLRNEIPGPVKYVPALTGSSIRARIMVLVVLAALPTLAVTLYRAWTARAHAIVSDAQVDIQRLATLAAQQQERIVEGARRTSRSRFR